MASLARFTEQASRSPKSSNLEGLLKESLIKSGENYRSDKFRPYLIIDSLKIPLRQIAFA